VVSHLGYSEWALTIKVHIEGDTDILSFNLGQSFLHIQFIDNIFFAMSRSSVSCCSKLELVQSHVHDVVVQDIQNGH